jgi:hypothetical protein
MITLFEKSALFCRMVRVLQLLSCCDQPGRSLTCAGLERSIVITADFSSTTATQPAVARFRYLFRCSSRLPWRLSVEYTLPMSTQSRPRRKSGISSRACQANGVHASFSPSRRTSESVVYRATVNWPRPDGVARTSPGVIAARTALSTLPATLRSWPRYRPVSILQDLPGRCAVSGAGCRPCRLRGLWFPEPFSAAISRLYEVFNHFFGRYDKRIQGHSLMRWRRNETHEIPRGLTGATTLDIS